MAEREEAGTAAMRSEGKLPQKLISENFQNESKRETICQSPTTPEKSSKLLSSLLAVNVVLLGAAFILSSIFNRASGRGTHVLILLMVLNGLTMGWMLFHQSTAHSVRHQDLHAGAIWLRGAVLLFGVCSIVLDIFKTGYFLQKSGGDRSVNVFYPIVEAIFISVQTYFLWFHSKGCTHVRRNIARCGLMLTVATDLVLWMNAETDDSIHLDFEIEEQTANNGSRTLLSDYMNTTALSCQSKLCTIFRKSVVIMYPFNIEYYLISSTMLYIMWTNVGRIIDHHATHANYKFRGYGLVLGPLLGTVPIIFGMCMFIMYQIEVSTDPSQPKIFEKFYAFHIVLLSVMSLCSLAGTAVHRWEERNVDSKENPTRSLDVVLLQIASLGEFCISYFSIVAVVSTHHRRSMDVLNLTYSVFMIIEHVMQNLFIIEGLHRQLTAEELGLSSGEMSEKILATDPQHETFPLEIVPGVHEPTEATLNTNTDGQDELSDANRVMNCSSKLDLRKNSQISLQTPSKLNWKRKFLKEISIFMIMCNLILWIIPAFGAHPQFENGLEKRFYGFSTWFTIVNFGLPLGVFYRMHSAGNLLEIYLTA
ncbi:proton channel OTOP3-like [Scyliorhinus canicula]|uniref:proton channel OTOP3-like n=1 Tax=Scyliorhinus canicula TaxID=7830 RepID=UPI0018F4B6E2|nr:proton channel OTOP3-like [Scyliorhinus canicula]